MCLLCGSQGCKNHAMSGWHLQPANPSRTFHTSVAAATAAPAYAAASAAATGAGGAPPHRLPCRMSASRDAGRAACSTAALQWAGLGGCRSEGAGMDCGTDRCMHQRWHAGTPLRHTHLIDSHASFASPRCTNHTNRSSSMVFGGAACSCCCCCGGCWLLPTLPAAYATNRPLPRAGAACGLGWRSTAVCLGHRQAQLLARASPSVAGMFRGWRLLFVACTAAAGDVDVLQGCLRRSPLLPLLTKDRSGWLRAMGASGVRDAVPLLRQSACGLSTARFKRYETTSSRISAPGACRSQQ